jgi:spore germination cell wall hydrolase CwlJ-like protein
MIKGLVVVLSVLFIGVSIPNGEDADLVAEKQDKEVTCLAKNIYHEARGESELGQRAVAQVVVNRSRKSGKSMCDVVYSRTERSCQFSWVCQTWLHKIREQDRYDRAKEIAEDVYLGRLKDVTHGATFYHATYVNPGWHRNKNFHKTAKIGTHVFYAYKKETVW